MILNIAMVTDLSRQLRIYRYDFLLNVTEQDGGRSKSVCGFWFDCHNVPLEPKYVICYTEQKPLGRPRRRWEDGIRVDLRETGLGGVDWIRLSQDRDRWRAVVSAVMNLRVLAPRS
jgi:hypothetical protein